MADGKEPAAVEARLTNLLNLHDHGSGDLSGRWPEINGSDGVECR